MEGLLDKQSEIHEGLTKIQKEIDALDNKEPLQREKAITKIEKMFGNIKSVMEAFEYDRIELAASSDLSNSGTYESALKDYEKQYDDLQNKFLLKKDPHYMEKLQALISQGKIDPGDSSRLIMQADFTQQAGTKALQNTLAILTQTHQVADGIAVDLESQIQKLQKALITVKDTRSDIKTAQQYVAYFGKELYKDKVWRILILLVILVAIAVVCLKQFGYSSNVPKEDILNGII